MPVIAIEHVRQMRGGAQSQLLRAHDGNFYIVKFVNNPQHPRVLANEWLCAHLAGAIGLPIPAAEAVHIPLALVDQLPRLRCKNGHAPVPCGSGLQFGSRLVTAGPDEPTYDFLPAAAARSIENLEDFVGILAFDKWTCNCDSRQVVFARSGQRLRVHMVDQGHCFNGGEWGFPDSPLRGVCDFAFAYLTVTGWRSFEPWLERIRSLDEQRVYMYANAMPESWFGRQEDLDRLVERLMSRRRIVPDLIRDVRDLPRKPFANWGRSPRLDDASAQVDRRLPRRLRQRRAFCAL